MTKEEALAAIKAHLELMEKPMPEYGTEAHDEYRVQSFSLRLKVQRAMREHPNLREEGDEPMVTSPAKKL